MHVILKNAVILKLNAFYSLNFVIKEMKGRTIISNKQNFENKAFWMDFVHLKIKIKEKFKLKTNPLTSTLTIFHSFPATYHRALLIVYTFRRS